MVLKLKSSSLPIDDNWSYWEHVKPNRLSPVSAYLRHVPCDSTCWTAGNVVICSSCKAYASDEVVKKAIVILKMRLL